MATLPNGIPTISDFTECNEVIGIQIRMMHLAKERLVIELLTQILGREPNMEDAKNLTLITHPKTQGFLQIQEVVFMDVFLGQIMVTNSEATFKPSISENTIKTMSGPINFMPANK